MSRDIATGRPTALDLDEPRRAAQQRLRCAVIRAGHGVGGHGCERFGAGEHRTPGADPIGLSQRCEQRVGVDLLGVGFVAGDRRECVGVEAVVGGSLSPCRDQVIGGGVVLRRPGAQHDVFDLVGVRATTDLGFEFGECVVDLVAPLGELTDDRVVDAGDLPAALAARPPTDTERGGELVAHLGGGQRGGGVGVGVEGP